jgi:hypothetical protein
VPDAITQLILRIVGRVLGGGVAPRTALDGDDVQPGIGELIRHDRASPAETDDGHIPAGQFPCHGCYPLRGVHSGRPPMLTGGYG